jgi:hypothetical protein
VAAQSAMTGIIARESLDAHNKISNSGPIATGRPLSICQT